MAIGRRNRAIFLQRTRGVTVLELLIVMTILLMITASTIPFVLPAVQNRRMRESSRLVSSFLSGARSRAIETSRPVGVVFQRLNGQPFSVTLAYVETPPPYSGDTSTSRCSPWGPVGGPYQVDMTDGAGGSGFNNRLVRIGDQIQFNFQGPYYQITQPDTDMDGLVDDGTTTLVVAPIGASATSRFPWPSTSGTGPKVQYQIIRQPVRSASGSLQLPEGTGVDLASSGIPQYSASGSTETCFEFNSALLSGMTSSPPPPLPVVASDPVILFGPQGQVVGVHRWTRDLMSGAVTITLDKPGSTIYLLMGRRELMPDVNTKNTAQDIVDRNLSVPDPANPALLKSPADSFWVSVGAQTGFVAVAEVASNAQNYTANTTWRNVIQSSLVQARSIAQTAQSVGGR